MFSVKLMEPFTFVDLLLVLFAVLLLRLGTSVVEPLKSPAKAEL